MDRESLGNIHSRLVSRLRTNILDIDQEVIEMPVLIQECGERLAHLVSARDIATVMLKEAEADGADDLRSTPYQTSGEDAKSKQRSEKQIETELPTHPLVVNARKRLEQAKLDVGIWQALYDGMRAKRDGMENLCRLIIAGYITGVSINAVQRAAIRNRDAPAVSGNAGTQQRSDPRAQSRSR